MRTMKDSGIEWIGEIPENWKVERLKWILNERKEKNEPQKTDFILSLGVSYGVIPYSEKEGGGNKAKETLTEYKLAYPNDIVMNSMNIISGSVGISRYFGCVSPVYYVFYPYNEKCNSTYYYYLFQTTTFQRSLIGLGNGILIKESSNGNFNTVRMRIPMEKLGIQLLPLPTKSEQQKISACLDRKCTEIDSVISKTKATIEEYKKLKQSVITQAVTKGIVPNRPMKDSGIEWIGETPTHWIVSKAKYYVKISNGSDPQTEGTIPVYGSGAQSFKTCGEYKIGPCVLIGRKGATLHIPHYIDHNYWNVDTAFDVKIISDFDLKFYYYLACCFDYKLYISQTTLPGMTQTNYENMFVPVPTVKEQKEIANYLDEKCSEIDKLIAKKEQLLTEMENYKKAVIYEYITGKKEV